jgi:hypothetical protein
MSKLRLLGLFAGAVAAFSVVGFAESFNLMGSATGPLVNAEGEALVTSCDSEVKVVKSDKWRDPATGGLPGDGAFFVDSIQLIQVDAACGQMWAYVVLTGAAGQKLAIQGMQLPVPPGNPEFDFSASNIKVADLHDIHVLLSQTPQKP